MHGHSAAEAADHWVLWVGKATGEELVGRPQFAGCITQGPVVWPGGNVTGGQEGLIAKNLQFSSLHFL